MHCFFLRCSWLSNLDFVQCTPWSQISFWSRLQSYSIYPCMQDRSSHALNNLHSWLLSRFSSTLRLLFQTCINSSLLPSFLHDMLSWLAWKLKLLNVPNLLAEVSWIAPLLQNLYFGWQRVLSTFLLFFSGSIGRFSMGCDSGWATKKIDILLIIILSSHCSCLCCFFMTHSQAPGWTHLRIHQSVVTESWDSEGTPGFQL